MERGGESTKKWKNWHQNSTGSEERKIQSTSWKNTCMQSTGWSRYKHRTQDFNRLQLDSDGFMVPKMSPSSRWGLEENPGRWYYEPCIKSHFLDKVSGKNTLSAHLPASTSAIASKEKDSGDSGTLRKGKGCWTAARGYGFEASEPRLMMGWPPGNQAGSWFPSKPLHSQQLT